MTSAKLRKVGGSAMLAIPPELLETMQTPIGTVFELTADNGALVARPARPKYSLKQLLDEEKAAGIDPLAAATDWTEAEPEGRELW